MADRSLEEILVNLRKRVALLERGTLSGKGMTRRSLGSIIRQVQASSEWAGKSGPWAYGGPYNNTWARGVDSGGTVQSGASNVIDITQDGVYEIEAHQRGTDPSSYIALALNGNRGAFEARSQPASGGALMGVWTHSHAGGLNSFSSSYYLGKMLAGDKVTAGPANNTSGTIFADAASTGFMTVRRIS